MVFTVRSFRYWSNDTRTFITTLRIGSGPSMAPPGRCTSLGMNTAKLPGRIVSVVSSCTSA